MASCNTSGALHLIADAGGRVQSVARQGEEAKTIMQHTHHEGGCVLSELLIRHRRRLLEKREESFLHELRMNLCSVQGKVHINLRTCILPDVTIQSADY